MAGRSPGVSQVVLGDMILIFDRFGPLEHHTEDCVVNGVKCHSGLNRFIFFFLLQRWVLSYFFK